MDGFILRSKDPRNRLPTGLHQKRVVEVGLECISNRSYPQPLAVEPGLGWKSSNFITNHLCHRRTDDSIFG